MGINFLQKYGGVISLPTSQLYLTETSRQANAPIALTMLAKASTIMTIPCMLPCSRNYLNPLDSWITSWIHPVVNNAENKNLPVHFMNHSDQDVVIPKHSYVVAMENVQEWNQNIYLSDTSPEPVNQCTLSKCLGKSDLPNQNQQLYNAP